MTPSPSEVSKPTDAAKLAERVLALDAKAVRGPWRLTPLYPLGACR